MQVHCPQCGAAIPVDDVNLQTLAARCRQCNNIFSVADIVRSDTGQVRLPPIDADASIPQPRRMHLEEVGNNWIVSWRWFTPAVIFLVVFCCVWDPVTLFSSTAAYRADPGWVTLLFPIPFFIAAILLTYLTLASLFNKTTLRIDGSELSVQIGPIPWRGNRTINTDDIRRVFFKPIVTRNRNRQSVWYRLYAVDNDEQLLQLVSGVTDINEAIFLQRTLERKLKLNPSPIGPAA